MSELHDYYYWHPVWSEEYNGAYIIDPDGWNRKDPDCLKEPITYEEFKRRAMFCTVMWMVKE